MDGRRDHPDAVKGGPSPAPPEVQGYEVLERIGKGGMGEVYVARQLALGRLVAIKFLNSEDEPDLEEDLARFRREATLMARVSHPNILSIFDFGEAEGRPYLVMEYVEGGDLRRRMRGGHPFSPDQVRAIVLPVGEALAYLHRHGIIHRDLKPENILLHDGGNPRVSDFGIAVLRAGSGSLTQTDRALGTLGYIAPEQQYRLKVDERADQFSLAALAYEMLTGQLPLGIFKPPSHLNSRIGPQVDSVLLRALQEDPKDRFATIREFAAALGYALAGASGFPRMPTLWQFALAGSCLFLIAGAMIFRQMRPISRPAAPKIVGRPAASSVAGSMPSRVPTQKANPPSLKSSAPGETGARRANDLPPPRESVLSTADSVALTEELKQLRAHEIWKARGSPIGEEGEAVKDEIWFEAAKSIEEELKLRAYQIWQTRGSPTGKEGKAVQDEIWAEAQRNLFQKLSGRKWTGPASH